MKRSRLNPVNSVRKKRRFKKAYGSKERVEFYSSRPCDVCGVRSYMIWNAAGTDFRWSNCAAHVLKTKGAGGGPEDCCTHCGPCEREFHQTGRDTMSAKHDIDYDELCGKADDEWKRHEQTLP